ncbi:MAG: hypothetical protein ABEH56_02610 [Salinirussus sp.]
MPAKVTGPAETYREVDRWPAGVGWIAHPEETMRRASHALATADGVWVVDPVDAAGVDDLFAEFGDVAGVVVLSNYHRRDAGAVARRHDVPVFLPKPMTDLATTVDAPVECVAAGTTFGAYELFEVDVDSTLGVDWFEFGLYDGETLVVGESVGGAPYLRVGDERLGVMLLRRLSPPRDSLGGLEPERVLGGHGAGVHENAAAALSDALDNARRRYLRAVLENGPSQVRTALAAVRS